MQTGIELRLMQPLIDLCIDRACEIVGDKGGNRADGVALVAALLEEEDVRRFVDAWSGHGSRAVHDLAVAVAGRVEARRIAEAGDEVRMLDAFEAPLRAFGENFPDVATPVELFALLITDNVVGRSVSPLLADVGLSAFQESLLDLRYGADRSATYFRYGSEDSSARLRERIAQWESRRDNDASPASGPAGPEP